MNFGIGVGCCFCIGIAFGFISADGLAVAVLIPSAVGDSAVASVVLASVVASAAAVVSYSGLSSASGVESDPPDGLSTHRSASVLLCIRIRVVENNAIHSY
eukprot:6183384-Pleurochrysis_carterae.AAC.1